jgi:hypothetical protein
MDFNSLIGPAVVAACVSGVVSIVGMMVSNRTARAIHTEKLGFDREQAERKVSADIASAEKKLALDRAFAAWKRRTELAEEVLADFYQARDIIMAARSPGGFGDEGSTRQKEPWETEDDTRLLNSYFRTAERLLNKSEFFAQLAARRKRFLALFGQEAANPYDEIFRIRGEILIAVRMLITTHQQRELGSRPQNRETWETTMGWVHTAHDPIEVRLNQLIVGIEEICRPVIQEVAP